MTLISTGNQAQWHRCRNGFHTIQNKTQTAERINQNMPDKL